MSERLVGCLLSLFLLAGCLLALYVLARSLG